MLIQYLDNELGPDERLLVESQLNEDAALQEQLNRLSLAKQAFALYARRQQVSAIHAEMMKERSSHSRPAPVRYLRVAMRVAALIVVLLLIGGVVQYSLLNTDRLYDSHYQAYTFGTSRGAENASALVQAYSKGDLRQVIAVYESSSPKQAGDHFLAGQAYLSTNNPQKAIIAFEAQLKANETVDLKPYHEDSEYYLALAWLKAGSAAKALPLFQKIHDQKAHAYNREVSSWYLTQLNWLKRKQSN